MTTFSFYYEMKKRNSSIAFIYEISNQMNRGGRQLIASSFNLPLCKSSSFCKEAFCVLVKEYAYVV